MSQDVMICLMNSTTIFDDVNVKMQSSESCVKCLDLDAELLIKQNVYNDLLKSYSQLEKHCVSLELTIQLNQEIFQKESFTNNQNALEIPEYFENNDLKAQLQAKDTIIFKLKEHIKMMRENDKEEKFKLEMEEIETINSELEHRNRSQRMNFVGKFLGTVRFRNDQVVKILGYGDYQLGNIIISRVYYVEGLGHNLFSIGQFCDADLEVAFRKNTCFIQDLKGVDLLSGSRDTNLYTISFDDMLKTSLICLLSKASKTKSWLWHRRLSHLNFGTLNKLAKDGLARGIRKLKF
ncbi:retrovirus-related pol polyprotein from transposon TNT 1-94 [Tanacetum coccineum]